MKKRNAIVLIIGKPQKGTPNFGKPDSRYLCICWTLRVAEWVYTPAIKGRGFRVEGFLGGLGYVIGQASRIRTGGNSKGYHD